MARVKGAMHTRKRRKKILKLAKGYRGAKSKLYKTANQAVMKSLVYAYRDRKAKKREFRQLWIARINAAARMNGISYSQFMNGLKKNGIEYATIKGNYQERYEQSKEKILELIRGV